MIQEAPRFSVSDFVAVFNQTLGAIYPDVKIVGEVFNFRISKGRWVYFDLKDEYSSVKFFGVTTSLSGPIEDGMSIEVSGKPYLHPQFNFSVQFYNVAILGEGNLAKAYQILYKKLDNEGLFNPQRKRPLPAVSQRIGLVASSESAGYGDFVKIAKNRWPSLDIKLFDVLVQGSDAPAQIVKAISDANQMDLDALVIVRGGGSRDDLVAFDDERVVRAVASSRAPTLVAIGHERDEVLAELVADMRASTPSNAGEIIVPDIREEKQYLKALKLHLKSLINGFYDIYKQDIANSAHKLDTAINTKLLSSAQWLETMRDLVTAHDPKLPLQKGYNLAFDRTGKLIRTAKKAHLSEEFTLEFVDDKINVKEV